MYRQEKVFLALSERVGDIQAAADLFAKQYGSVHVSIRGRVLDTNNASIYLDDWYTVGVMSANLNLIGVGDVSKDEEHFCWVIPTSSGEIQLTTLQAARRPQAA